MKSLQFFVILIPLLLLSGCKMNSSLYNQAMKVSGGIPVVGLDESGQSKVNYISKKIFKHHVSRQIDSLSQEVPKAIEQKDFNNGWFVAQVILGIGFNLEAGITPLLTVSQDITFRFWFRDIQSYY